MSLAAPPQVAVSLVQQVEREAASLKAGEVNLLKGYAKFARLLVQVKITEAWKDAGHPSFGSYILGLSEKYGRSHQQIFAYIKAAELLLPYAGEDGLDKMGITKAMEIVRASKHPSSKMSSQQVVDATKALVVAALDDKTDVQQIRATAYAMFECAGKPPKGKYFDFGGAFFEPEDYKEFVEAVKMSIVYLELPADMPDHLKRQKIFSFWAKEVLGTYAAEVYGRSNS